MATLNETIEQVQNVFNDIEGALQEQGVDTENLKPVDYANAVRGIVNESVKEIGIFPAIIFTYSKRSEMPTIPVGGKWVIDPDNKNGRIIPPDGWYSDLNEVEDVSTTSDQIWMSTATFKNDGEIYTNWITPFRISGKDGKDGKNGEQGVPGPVIGTTQYFYTPYYIEITDGSTPIAPSGTYVDGLLENVTQGWATSIAETSYQGTWWMSTASYNSSMTNGDPASFTTPVRISTTSADRKQGTTRYYILSDSPKIPTINDSDWLIWVDGVAPSLQKPYLFCKDVTSYSQSDTETSPPYLLTTYSNGLKSIDFDYTCGESKDVVTSEAHPWFNSTEEALIDNPETGYLGLTEETKFLWCREKFIYVDELQNESFYRILSSYTAAEKAAIIYPAGTFKPEVFYTRTEEQRPYIWYPEGLKLNSNGEVDENGETYYYFVLKYSYDDDFHKVDINSGYTFESAYRNGNWEKMESFAAIHADVGLIEAGRVGQLVFDDRYIFSQWGKDKSGNSRKYEEFTEYPTGFENIDESNVPEDSRRTGIAFAIECGDFIPNILLNAITGEAKFGGGTSVLRADGSGYLADGKIEWKNNGDLLVGDNNGFMAFKDGELSLSGSVNIGVDENSLSNWPAFTSIKGELDIKANEAMSEANVAKTVADAAKTTAETASNDISDMKYLKNALGDAKSLAVGGVVMSQIVAVADVENAEDVTEADVKAFLNGSGYASDTTHGKLILAGGIPESTEGGSTDPEARAKEAATKIYETGRIETNDIHLRDGATIGDTIRVVQDGFELDGPDDGKISINEAFGVTVSNSRVIARIGGTCGKPAAIEIGNIYGGFMCPTDNVGMAIAMLDGEAAVRCIGGVFEGLRPKVRMITASSTSFERTLTEFDHTILVTALSGTETISLPSQPQEGQRYEIYTIHAALDLTIDFNGQNTYSITEERDYNGSNANFTANQRRHITLIYAGEKWWMTYVYLTS